MEFSTSGSGPPALEVEKEMFFKQTEVWLLCQMGAPSSEPFQKGVIFLKCGGGANQRF